MTSTSTSEDPGINRRITVILDPILALHLADAGMLSQLGSIAGWEFVVPSQLFKEMGNGVGASAIEAAVQAGNLRSESSTEVRELGFYAEFRQRMGQAEATCLAIAQARGWSLASGDHGQAFRRIVQDQIGPDRLIDVETIRALVYRPPILPDTEVESNRTAEKMVKR